ncbi:3D domain-containing protein [Haloimpatiens sp. FM7330]|uniref:3D domain-containing protein n=1 Tax=Haloimpatiens sp. FM7330 TaxID=3298610 RepID=UPI003636FE97
MKKQLILLVTIIVIGIIIAGVYIPRKKLTVIIDGKKQIITTYKDTVKEVLQNEKIKLDSEDKITPSLDSKIANHQSITIKKAIPVKISVDAKNISLKSSEENVESLLKIEGITLGNEDKLMPSKDTKLSKDMEITITRVKTKTVKESKPIAFKTIVQNKADLPNTTKKTVQEGTTGEKQILTQIVYENNKEVSRKVVSEKVVKAPVNKVIHKGSAPKAPVSRGGYASSSSRVINVKSTAYSPINGARVAYTASGMRAARNPGGYSTIAVDPRIIPLGTKVYVEGYGLAIAADTGTAIKGNKVDVFFNTYREACRWGVKYVKVYILK